MNFLKKCAAVLLTGAMVLSMSACSSDTDWIMRKGELEMPAGVYINNLLQSYYQASTLVENTEEDVLKQQVEGTDAKEWIQQQALDETKRNMAACSEFNEHKLSFTQDELESCRQQAEAYYEQNGENLEKNGISQNSIELLYQIAYMKNKLFDALYAQGGEQEVSEKSCAATTRKTTSRWQCRPSASRKSRKSRRVLPKRIRLPTRNFIKPSAATFTPTQTPSTSRHRLAWMQDRAGTRCSTPTNSRMQRLPVRSTT